MLHIIHIDNANLPRLFGPVLACCCRIQHPSKEQLVMLQPCFISTSSTPSYLSRMIFVTSSSLSRLPVGGAHHLRGPALTRELYHVAPPNRDLERLPTPPLLGYHCCAAKSRHSYSEDHSDNLQFTPQAHLSLLRTTTASMAR